MPKIIFYVKMEKARKDVFGKGYSVGITTKDLAEICGVSRTTVNRALQGTGRIKEDTKKRILDTAKQLGYEPDLVARSLVSGKSMMIGVIIVDLKNQYYPKMVNAIAERVLEDNYILNITIHRDDKEMEKKLVGMLTGHRVDGLIISPINKGRPFYNMMEKIKVPYCILGIDEFEGCPAVGVDEVAAGKEAAEHILGKGYERVAFVAPPMYDSDGILNMGHHKRLAGFVSVMQEQNHKYDVLMERESTIYLQQVLDFIRSSGAQKPGLLCSGAVYAIKIMGFLKKNGYNAPGDYGIMTFDEVSEYENLFPRLTCLDNHVEKVGYTVGDLMIKMIRGEQTEQRIVIPHNIIEGQTL